MVEKLLKLATPQDPIQELVKRRDTASQEELAASQKVTGLETKKAQNEAERAATQAKAKETATTELTARQAEREKPIKEEKGSIDKQLMNASFEPSKENLESQVALFSLINVIGFAIGSGGKQNAQQAMSAMNGMLEGHQKGREDVFKQEKVKFDSNFKALQSKATFLENELRHSLEEFTRDKRAADERAAAAFAEAGADFMKTYAEKNGLVATYERAKEVRKAADKAVTDEQTRQQRIQDKIDAEARAESQRVIDDRRRLAEREEFAKFAAGLKGGAGGAGSDTASDVKNFTGVNFGTGKQADTKYDQVAAAANTMAEALALSNAVRKNPDVVGRMGQAKGFIDRYVKSLSSDGLETDKTPAATNKAEQDALLFSKRYAAYLIRYEQALAGSAKGFTVSFMNRFNNLMQQNQFNPEGFDGLMKEQIREIHARTASLSTKITPESMIRLGVAQTRDPDAIEALQRMQGGVGAAPAAAPVSAGPGGAGKRGGAIVQAPSGGGKVMPNEEKLKEYARAPAFGGDVEKAKEYLRSQGYK